MAACTGILSILFFVIGFIVLMAPEGSRQAAVRAPFTPVPNNPIRRPLPPSAPAGGQSAPGGNPMATSGPQKLEWMKIGGQIKFPHPVKGEMTEHVLGRILFTELWQQSRGPQNPWVPTGNTFAGYWLNGEMLVLNWQNRFYLLDENHTLSDSDIQRDFAPHARKFAQSDQTADVYFAYPPASWHIDDIGKFQVASIDGAVLNGRPGAIGRFIHASGDGGRALVLEDYEGGAQDTVWLGYQMQETDFKPA